MSVRCVAIIALYKRGWARADAVPLVRLTKSAPSKGKLAKKPMADIAAFQHNANTLFHEVEVGACDLRWCSALTAPFVFRTYSERSSIMHNILASSSNSSHSRKTTSGILCRGHAQSRPRHSCGSRPPQKSHSVRPI